MKCTISPLSSFLHPQWGGNPLIKVEECNAQGYIQKPFEIETLFKEIEKHLGPNPSQAEGEATK